MSENKCCICPNYSLRVLVWTMISLFYYLTLMRIPWIYFTIYKETIKEIGTKFVKSKIQAPQLINNLFPTFSIAYMFSSISIISYWGNHYSINSVYRLEITPSKAHKKVRPICIIKMTATMIPILNYNLDFFCLVLLEFNIIFVSTPV